MPSILIRKMLSGENIDYRKAKQREREYSKDPKIGSYMFFFEFKNQRWCIDATKETSWKGRLINHSFLRPNLRTEVSICVAKTLCNEIIIQLVVDHDGNFYLGLFAIRDIAVGEELLYDYGDHSAETVAGNPWIINT